LNEEVLGLQEKLRSRLKRSEGTLLPDIAPEKKRDVFDLVAQLLQSALAEVGKMVPESSLTSRQVLERAFPFAFALQHAKEVAVPAEVKTQALKLAALLDVDLLCQIIEGPFKRKLLGLGSRRPGERGPPERRNSCGSFAAPPRASMTGSRENWTEAQRRRSAMGDSNGFSAPPRASLHSSGGGHNDSWNDAVNSFCGRLVHGLRDPLQLSAELASDNKEN